MQEGTQLESGGTVISCAMFLLGAGAGGGKGVFVLS